MKAFLAIVVYVGFCASFLAADYAFFGGKIPPPAYLVVAAVGSFLAFRSVE